MAKPEREVLFPAHGDVVVAALWYGEPSNCWRTEVRSNGAELDNMTYEETEALAEALLKACAPWRFDRCTLNPPCAPGQPCEHYPPDHPLHVHADCCK